MQWIVLNAFFRLCEASSIDHYIQFWSDLERLLSDQAKCDGTTRYPEFVGPILSGFIKRQRHRDTSAQNRERVRNDIDNVLAEMLKSSIKLKQLYHQSKEHVDLKQFSNKILEISNNIKMDWV